MADMNMELLKRLYAEATEHCIMVNSNEAWIFEKKFAELIVRECAGIARGKQVFIGYDTCTAIKDHFGVN